MLLLSPATMLNLPHSQAVLSVVPTRRDKFPPGPAVPDHIIIIMAPLFPLDIGPVSKSNDPDEPIGADPV